ncbi:GtrA family protein [Escherichia coli]|uniref:GtrA family protein n=2 Tax=Escherichia coli TaxID=562 RepID=UPI000BB768F1|nr:GtrA family protein [Escherichia coli]
MIIIKKPFFKFIISGGLNTATTYIVYILLLMFVNYKISYTISYITGIIFSYYLNKNFVFKAKNSIKSFLIYPLVYLFQYLLGFLLTWVWVEILKANPIHAPIIVVLLSMPVTFLLSRIIFTKLS